MADNKEYAPEPDLNLSRSMERDGTGKFRFKVNEMLAEDGAFKYASTTGSVLAYTLSAGKTFHLRNLVATGSGVSALTVTVHSGSVSSTSTNLLVAKVASGATVPTISLTGLKGIKSTSSVYVKCSRKNVSISIGGVLNPNAPL